MIVNVIRHLAFEDMGSFTAVLQAHDVEIKYFQAGVDDLSQLDALSDSLLVILGGPISVNDADMFPFIDAEIDLLRRRIAADKPTLGICLGAQLIASAMGAKIYSGQEKEIGWDGLQLTADGERGALRYLGAEHCSMLHWHGETFDLPAGAVLLASSSKYDNQAFSVGANILALQFHPEITTRGMEKWFIGHIGEIMQTPNISVEQLRQETHQYGNQLEMQGELFFNSWFNAVS
ncbi:MAG: glutamine amidotransferase [Gammaproteobacteria bacterium]|nr:glutamine amidotransferase [Gammaproteobacteria bacterium]